MLTQCPECGTIYRLGAIDLSAAQGFVECGECDAQFNALERLADEPSFEPPHTPAPNETASTESPSPSLDPSAIAQSAFGGDVEKATPIDPDATVELQRSMVASQAPPPTSSSDSASDVGADQAEQEPSGFESPIDVVADDGVVEVPDNAIELPPIDTTSSAPAATLSDAEHAILFTEPELEAIPEDVRDDSDPAIDLDDVPAILKAEVAALQAPRRGSMGIVWIVLASVMIILLAAQAAWVWRAPLIAALPQSAAWFESACARIGCSLETNAPVASIELVARDVRDHPRYRDTLLVNATLISRSSATAPFPVIQLGLHDNGGDIIGIRRFQPHEYLDVSIDLEAGMPPNRPVYIVLEIAQVSASAVGFEFSFM